MSLSNDDILRIARLARIAVAPDEADAAAARLNDVLGLVDQMRKVDTQGIAPMAHAVELAIDAAQPLREDAVSEADRRQDYQAVAPAVDAGLYLVPKVFE